MSHHPWEYKLLVEYVNPVQPGQVPHFSHLQDQENLTEMLEDIVAHVPESVPDGWEVQLRASETISLILLFLAAFAVAFQFPMAVLILVYMGLLTPATLKKYRRLAIVGLTIISAILTPPDPVSMMIMLFPLFLLYEGSIWLSYLVLLRKKRTGAET